LRVPSPLTTTKITKTGFSQEKCSHVRLLVLYTGHVKQPGLSCVVGLDIRAHDKTCDLPCSDGVPEERHEAQVVQNDADDLTHALVVHALDTHGERDDEQQQRQTDVDHRMLHLPRNIQEPVSYS